MIIGIDLGATYIKSALVDNGKIISEIYRTPTNAKLGKKGIVNSLFTSIKVIIKELLNNKKDNIEIITVSSAGDIDKDTSTITYATDNLPGVIGLNFDELIFNEFGIHAVALNDGEAALLGEIYHNNNLNTNSKIVMLTFGTGIGAATYDNGKVEVKKYGHYELVKNGYLCTCGKRGCAEVYLSCKAITNTQEKLTNKKKEFFKEYLYNKDKSVANINEINNEIINFLDDYLNKLQTLLDYIKTDFDFDTVIIGGGLIDWIGDDFNEFYKSISYNLIPATLKNTAGILGAVSFYNLNK